MAGWWVLAGNCLLLPSLCFSLLHYFIHSFLTSFLPSFLPSFLSVFLSFFISLFVSVFLSVFLSFCRSSALYFCLSFILSFLLSFFHVVVLSVLLSFFPSFFLYIFLSCLSFFISFVFSCVWVLLYLLFISSTPCLLSCVLRERPWAAVDAGLPGISIQEPHHELVRQRQPVRRPRPALRSCRQRFWRHLRGEHPDGCHHQLPVGVDWWPTRIGGAVARHAVFRIPCCLTGSSFCFHRPRPFVFLAFALIVASLNLTGARIFQLVCSSCLSQLSWLSRPCFYHSGPVFFPTSFLFITAVLTLVARVQPS